MRRRRIRIRGAGPAAIAVAKLLLDRGADIAIDPPSPRQSRIVAIPMDTVTLASRLLGIDREELLRTGLVVSERRVDWSHDGPATIPDPSLVCDAGGFSAALARSLRGASIAEDDDADWIVDATGRPSSDGHCGGERVGYATRSHESTSMNSILATESGWTFASPHPDGGTAAVSVVPNRAHDFDVPIAPRISAVLCDANRIAAGDAAFTVDPLRGDGVGYALRGALLAQAVIIAVEKGIDKRRCFAHYENRIHDAFVGHLRGCCIHYRAARSPLIWARDVAAMEELAARFDRSSEPFEFRLVGVDLVPEGGWRNGRLHSR